MGDGPISHCAAQWSGLYLSLTVTLREEEAAMFDGYPTTRSRVPAPQIFGEWVPLFRRTRFCASLKRAFDVIVACSILVLFAWAYAAIALAIVLESKGPVLFRQRRTGRYGKVSPSTNFAVCGSSKTATRSLMRPGRTAG